MNIFDFLTPVTVPAPGSFPFKGKSLYSSMLINRTGNPMDLEQIQVAIFGVEESRNAVIPADMSEAPNEIRKQLYQLYAMDFSVAIADLGNIKAGATIEDTYFAVNAVCSELMKKNVVPVLLGGSQDLTLPMFGAYEKLEQIVNLVTVDARLDFGENEGITDSNYLNAIVLSSPNYLFNYCNIADQRYLNPPELYRMLNELHFEHFRLGDVNQNVLEAEPYLRNADMVSFDLSAIRFSDFSSSIAQEPNGLYAEQACTLSYFAGFSDKLTSFGLFGLAGRLTDIAPSAALAAQLIWCFLDGYSKRKGDYPIGTIEHYLKYTVHFDREDHEITFFKSPNSDRWWMEVPYPAGLQNKYYRHYLVPCTYTVYQNASNDEIPDLWWMTYKKLV